MQQLCQARLLHDSTAAQAGGRPPCASLQEARARCLDSLGEFLVTQQSRASNQGNGQQPLQHTWSDMCTAAGMADVVHRSGASYIVPLPPKLDDAAAAAQ